MTVGQTCSGIRYAVRRSGGAVGYCALSIRCGTRDEGSFHSGIAHFTEHTIFKGTSRMHAAAINSCLDRLGGELNAYTTKEEIVIHATVLKEDLPKAARLLLDLASDATFPEKEIEVEKGVVLDEIASYKDSPADDVFDRFEEMLFGGHDLGRPILGTNASVKKITSDELKRFVKENFTPERMAFTVVAGEEESKLEKDVQKWISTWYSGHASSAVISPAPSTPPVGVLFDKTVEKKNHEVNAVLGATAPSLYEERERLAAVLLGNILAGPASNSILNRELREKKGWVYGVECTYTQYRDSGIMAISLGCDRDNLDKCMAVIGREIAKLQDNPLSDARLRAAKKQLIGQLAISSENGEAQCLAMGKSLLAFGRVSSDNEDRSKVESITSAELQASAQRILAQERISKLIYL